MSGGEKEREKDQEACAGAGLGTGPVSRTQDTVLPETGLDVGLILENMINAFIVWKPVIDGRGEVVSFRFGYFNEAYSRISKLKLEDVLGKDVFEVWPETEKSWVQVYGQVALTGTPATFEMYHYPTRGLYHCNAYRPGNTPDRVCVIFEDITERSRYEQSIRESEEKYRALVETTDTGFVIIDPEGNVLDANEEYVRLAGKSSIDEVIGRNVTQWTAPHDRERNAGEVRHCFEQGFIRNLRVDYGDGTGRVVPVEVNATVINTEKGQKIVSLCRDISDRIRAEEEKSKLESQLLQSQKMESIGTLAGGIAHDFNNILTAIIGYASLLQSDMDRDDPKRAYVKSILSSSQKAASLTRSLLAFSRKQVIELKPLKVGEIVKEMAKILPRLLTEDIELEVLSSDMDDMVIMGDLSQIDQVILNLATNARDAMPEGGKLLIETKTVCLDREFVDLHGFGEPGVYALISVTDTGHGMDEKTREKVFEPFFTTKEVGKGTGLGLAMVYGIVTQHRGYAVVHSTPGVGTTVRVYLPAAAVKVEGEARVVGTVRGGKETILLAEDNSELRGLMSDVLSRNGYRVIESRDGEDALGCHERHKDEINLYILDVVMPRKNGKEVYNEILKTTPHARVLFTSGYTGDVVLTKGVRDESVDFISKPLSPVALLLRVREILDR